MTSDKPDEPTTLSAEEARQAQIILNTPKRRFIFFGGLAVIILLPLIGILIWH